MKKFLFISIVLFSIMAFCVPKSYAASVSVSTPEVTKVGDTFSIIIKADTGGESINSADIVLDYPEDKVSFVGYKDGTSLVKIWVKSPYEKDGKIYLSGIIPGGASGLYDPDKEGLSEIPIADLSFVAKGEGTADFLLLKSQVLKNDGMGTELVHEQKNGQVTILKSDGKSENVTDKNPPEEFKITFLESSIFSRTPSMILFGTSDKESGIKEYKIKEGSSNWKDGESPQPISKKIFPENITVRAYDFYGNFRDSTITVPGSFSAKILFIIIGLLVSGIFVFRVLKYRA